MAQIEVKVRSDVGDLGTHRKYGPLVKGAKMIIDEEDFGAGIFERPAGFLSPLEREDQRRAAELGERVGEQDPPPGSERPAPEEPQAEPSGPETPAEEREV